MAVRINRVAKKSPAARKGIKDGDNLLTINYKPINDFLDYQFYSEDKNLRIEIEREGRKIFTRVIKDESEALGLEFDSYLMDEQRRCRNKCIFCFIDQMPEGMRKSLYFKDDDSRLSFLFGNYITLTNLTQRDVDRIIEMHISPVNISVHTMNKELRVRMMKNKNAGECLDIIRKFAENGIEINTQLVLCPGINDGDELRYSLKELGKLYPGVQSIAAVPVGVTKYREGLFEMSEYNKETAREVIDIINSFAEDFKEKNGIRLAYAADEFYLKAELPMPDCSYYDDYRQIENGVGMWTSLRDEFLSALDEAECSKERSISVATGAAAYPLIMELSDILEKRFERLKINVYKINNVFFGSSITVAGLITGKDLINQLKGKELFGELLIPDVMLRSEGDIFLDDISIADVEKELDVKVTVTTGDGYDLLRKMTGEE